MASARLHHVTIGSLMAKDPTGGMAADLLTANAVNSDHYIWYVVEPGIYRFSAYLRSASSVGPCWAYIGSLRHQVWIDLQSGWLGSIIGGGLGIYHVMCAPDRWLRCSIEVPIYTRIHGLTIGLGHGDGNTVFVGEPAHQIAVYDVQAEFLAHLPSKEWEALAREVREVMKLEEK